MSRLLIFTIVILSVNFIFVESILRIPNLTKLNNLLRRNVATVNIPPGTDTPPSVTPPLSSLWVPKADREALDVRIDDTWYDLSIWRKNHPAGNLATTF